MAEINKKRCAIYCRKSVEDGLEQEFNSLDAQREAGEAYIASQKANGWICLPERYDDGGFSGGNIDRPALKRLLKDCENGLVDIIVVYKIDRLSRSILDFAELTKMFDKWDVAFVSVTQEINTHTSAGRMMLNILITFAQFEREVITERVRDKMSASRKKGKWVGGSVTLGYKPENHKLVVVPEEAEIVKRIFLRFLETQSPKQIAFELNREHVSTKRGTSWDKQIVYRILTNRHYIGKVFYKGVEYAGEQEAIIDMATWTQCQDYMKATCSVFTDHVQKEENIAPLKGLLRCGCCNGAMSSTWSKKNGRKHCYYYCVKDVRRPISICPIRTISAGEIERVVNEQIKKILITPEVVTRIAASTGECPKDIMDLFSESFWNEITPGERQRLIQLLLERVTINESNIKIEIRTAGITSIMEEKYAN